VTKGGLKISGKRQSTSGTGVSSGSDGLVLDLGATLIVARHIVENAVPPPLGQIYAFSVFVQEDGGGIQPFSGTIAITSEVVRKARRLLRRYAEGRPRLWLMRRGRFLVCLDDGRNEDAKPWRTTPEELRRLIASAQDMDNEAARVRNGSWLAPYLASHWLPLLPNGEVPEFYRGFAHGSRIAIQVHIDLFRGLYTDDIVLLFDIYLAMGAESARRMLETTGELPLNPDRESLRDETGFPARLQKAHLTAPARFSRQQAETLMARHDPVRIARLVGEDPKSANGYLFFSDEEHVDFYRGAAASLVFFRRTVDGFLEGVIADPPPLLPAFSAGLETIAVLACHYWVRRLPH
jgi:hypothetical protein